MADLTDEQKRLIAESMAAAQNKLKNRGTVQVIFQGSGTLTSDNPHFQIEQKRD